MRKGSTGGSTACRSGRRQLLVLAPNWLGDVVMATPLLALLRRAFCEDLIAVGIREYAAGLLERCPLIDGMVTWPRGWGVRRVAARLRGERPGKAWDAAFVLPPSFPSALIARISGARRRIGYGRGVRRMLLTDVPAPDEGRARHLSESYARLAEPLGAGTESVPAPSIVPPYDWRERVERSGLSGRYAVLAAGASYGPAKVWPSSSYAVLARLLIGEGFGTVVLLGSAGERDALEVIVREAGGGIVNLAGRIDVAGLAAVLRGAGAAVGNDSGPVHIAAAMGVPTVALFGSTSPAWTAPRGPRAAVVSSGAGCSPCFKRVCPEGTTRCLTELSPDVVLDAVRETIRGYTG
ncbi:MAG: lipopolysaccharide heptosyltransferase II [Candidatus Krumholzibacteria bacterium]|nr:lipopolysaccharide heptosyltransferase II [Candidatus Krumholzibacteria bacterium]